MTRDEILARSVVLRAAYPTTVIREQFGRSMIALAEARSDLVALTADLMYATGMAPFGERFPERLINLGIAEQNMTGVAAGLASCGKLAVVCGYAAFTSLRAVEQAKVDCAYNEVKVILCGLSAGLSYGVGGPTHQTFEDIAIMRAIPNMTVLVPSDAAELDQALQAAARAPRPAPIFVRIGRGPEHDFNDPAQAIEIGRARKLREGDELCLIANGPMVFEAMIAADILAEIGIAASVLNVHSVKPIDRDAILAEARRVAGMIVIEEHSVHGGLGSAVLEVLRGGHAFPVELIGIEDVYPPIGPTFALRQSLGLSAESIAMRAIEMRRTRPASQRRAS
jgi:transketolase